MEAKYVIQPYTKERALEMGLIVKPSMKPNKKIDVYKNNVLIASVGAKGYYDYPTYIKDYGLEYADKRRALYKKRHNNNRHIIGSNGFLSSELLW